MQELNKLDSFGTINVYINCIFMLVLPYPCTCVEIWADTHGSNNSKYTLQKSHLVINTVGLNSNSSEVELQFPARPSVVASFSEDL